jgi:hypothetical protein
MLVHKGECLLLFISNKLKKDVLLSKRISAVTEHAILFIALFIAKF